jgi:hypothetical protein
VQRNLYDYEKQRKVNHKIAEHTALQFLLTGKFILAYFYGDIKLSFAISFCAVA